jgi:hypothetical protein
MKTSYSSFRAIFFKSALVIQIFGVFFLMSCETTKKTAATEEVNTTATVATNELKTSEILSFVDTTKITEAEISYTKIEFYPPAADTPLSDTIKSPATVKSPVKSIETFNIKYNTENKGITQTEEKSADSTQQNAVFVNSQKVDTITEQKAKHWLKYIMWIAVCATIMTVIIYAWKIFNKIKK